MDRHTSIVNLGGDYEETIQRLAEHLGTSKMRRRLFNAMYGRERRPRSKKEIMDAAGVRNSGNNAQQAQNELDHLAKHRLIVKLENNGRVKDGSRNLYQKDENVRSVKDKIIRYADNRKAAAKLATKRNPVIRGMPPAASGAKGRAQRALTKRKRLVVLYLTASPDRAAPLRVDAEFRAVQEEIRGSLFRDRIRVEHRPAADLRSLMRGLNDYRPQIVHFSGHGDSKGIVTDSGKVAKPATSYLSFDLLAKALKATDNPPDVVVLNACKSTGAKRKVLRAVKIVVAMRKTVSDIAAALFATNFYAAIAAGQSVKAAVAQGQVAVGSGSVREFHTPELLCAPGVDAAKIMLT